jgi:cell division septum initiation protein DivIVA
VTVGETLERDPLAPVRAALLEAAERDAARTVAAGRADAEAVLSSAAHDADGLRNRARAEGAADGRRVLETARARAGRRARATVLRAQGEVHARLRQEVRAAAARLREDPGYPALRERLVAEALTTLGPEATVTESPAGGVIAEAPGRTADLTLPALADRLLDSMAAEVVGVWGG